MTSILLLWFSACIKLLFAFCASLSVSTHKSPYPVWISWGLSEPACPAQVGRLSHPPGPRDSPHHDLTHLPEGSLDRPSHLRTHPPEGFLDRPPHLETNSNPKDRVPRTVSRGLGGGEVIGLYPSDFRGLRNRSVPPLSIRSPPNRVSPWRTIHVCRSPDGLGDGRPPCGGLCRSCRGPQCRWYCLFLNAAQSIFFK